MKTQEEKKDIVEYASAIIALLAGFALCFFSIFFPPKGAIHATVLTALGETLTFVGAVYGINLKSKTMLRDIDRRWNNNSEKSRREENHTDNEKNEY